MMVAEIELYKILKTKFTDLEAETIVASIGQQVHTSFEERKNDFATKEDIANLRTELFTKIAETNQKITENKAEIIKWNFIFWIGQLASFIAIAKFFFHQ
jgi:hypothetical protein